MISPFVFGANIVLIDNLNSTMESEEEDCEAWDKSLDAGNDFVSPEKSWTSEETKHKDDHSRVILHIDIDCFYAQVEMIRNPTLVSKPLGIQQKNIVVTCNYPARERGVTKLMYIKDAREKCPELTLVSGEDLTNYRETSYKISEFLQKFCPLVERLGFDENFLDITNMVNDRLSDMGPHDRLEVKGHTYESELVQVTDTCTCGCHRRLAVGSQIAADIRDGMYSELGLTCCGGVALNKLLSKLVAGTHKPNQQTTLFPEHTTNLMFKLASVRNIPGIGHSMAKKLKELGIVSVPDLHKADSSNLEEEFGRATADNIKRLCVGIDNSPVVAFGLPQTLSDEDSFKRCCTLQEVKLKVHQLLTSLLQRLLKDGRTPHTLRLTIRNRTKSYSRESRQCSIPSSIFTKFTMDSLPRVCSQLETLAVGLFTKLIDPKQAFHLTLINVAFAKLEQRSGGLITEFFSQKSHCVLSETTPKVHLSESPSSGCGTATGDQRKSGLLKWFSKSAATQSEFLDTDADDMKRKNQLQNELVSSELPRVSKHEENVTSKGNCLKNSTSFFKSVKRKASTSCAGEACDSKKLRFMNKTNSVYTEIPANIDRSVFDELPTDIQQEILAAATSSTSGERNVAEETKQSNMSGKSSEGLPTVMAHMPLTQAKMKVTSHQNREETTNACLDGTASREDSAAIQPTEEGATDRNIPSGIDKSVFVSLPKEIQEDLIKEWKQKPTACTAAERNSSQNKSKPSNILSYFSKCD